MWRQLAFLYLDPRNPEPDGVAAQAALKQYGELTPGDSAAPEVRALLTLHGRIEALAEELSRAQARNAELARRAEAAEQEREVMRQKIERLQELDLELEQKRRTVR